MHIIFVFSFIILINNSAIIVRSFFQYIFVASQSLSCIVDYCYMIDHVF